MAALTGIRYANVLQKTIKRVVFPLALNQTAWEGGIACYDTSAYGSMKTAVSGSATLVPIGWYTQSLTASASVLQGVGIELFRELDVWFYDAAASGTPTYSNLFQPLYLFSDHEVTTTTTSNSIAGRMFAFNPAGAIGSVGVVAPFGI